MRMGCLRFALGTLPALCLAVPAQAITVTATQNVTALVNALLGSGGTGIVVTNATLSGHVQQSFESPGAFETSSGTYTNGSGAYGIGSGIVLSTGAVEVYGDGTSELGGTSGIYFTPGFEFTEATPAQEALLDPITSVGMESFDHFDVTELVIQFDMQPGFPNLRFHIVFGSEEYPEFAEVG